MLKSSEIVVRNSEIGFMPLKLLKINYIFSGETISVTDLPILLIIQNLSQGNAVGVYTISSVSITPIQNSSASISINDENQTAWVNMKLDNGVLKITNRRVGLGISVNAVGISLK